MKNKLTKEELILPSRCDYKAEIGLAATVDMFLDMAMEHAEELNVGITEYSKKNLFWVATKTKVHFNRPVKMAEKVTMESWPEVPGRAKSVRQYRIKNKDEVCVMGKTEWIIIDTVNKSMQKLENVFPEGFEFYEDNDYPEDFERLRDFTDGELLGEYKVRSIDIDYGLHMNNVAYIRAITGLFSSKELDERKFKDFQIDYKVSCFEGDILKVSYKVENGAMYLKGEVSEGKAVFLAKLS